MYMFMSCVPTIVALSAPASARHPHNYENDNRIEPTAEAGTYFPTSSWLEESGKLLSGSEFIAKNGV